MRRMHPLDREDPINRLHDTLLAGGIPYNRMLGGCAHSFPLRDRQGDL